MSIKIYKKNSPAFILPELSVKEYSCNCAYEFCENCFISSELIEAFKKFRTLIGVPVVITSGQRCRKYNKLIGGTPLSRHITGEAMDIALDSLKHLEQDDIELALIKSGFSFIKFYDKFVHADVRQ